jgi:FkbM family methyltransferase
MLRSYLSRLSSNFPALFYVLKKMDLVAHYVLRIQYEPEFFVLTKLVPRNASLLIVDIGANVGQSGLDFSALFPRAQIRSFEANPQLEVFLRHCRSLIGNRFQFRMVGMSDSPKKLDIFVPKRGNVFIYGEASVHAAVFDDESVKQRIGEFVLSRFECNLIDFDSTGLVPNIVKIDVQGHELQVLLGMKHTLSTCRPHFVIERSAADDKVMAFLRPFGYDFFVSDQYYFPVPYNSQSACVNLLCVPSGTTSTCSRIVGGPEDPDAHPPPLQRTVGCMTSR